MQPMLAQCCSMFNVGPAWPYIDSALGRWLVFPGMFVIEVVHVFKTVQVAGVCSAVHGTMCYENTVGVI